MILQPLIIGNVAIDDGGPARFEPAEDLRLGIGDLFDGTEEAQVNRRNRGDNGDMRPYQPRQRVDLARMVHANLEHTEAGAPRHIGKR